jgi:hypothetical protein
VILEGHLCCFERNKTNLTKRTALTLAQLKLTNLNVYKKGGEVKIKLEGGCVGNGHE